MSPCLAASTHTSPRILRTERSAEAELNRLYQYQVCDKGRKPYHSFKDLRNIRRVSWSCQWDPLFGLAKPRNIERAPNCMGSLLTNHTLQSLNTMPVSMFGSLSRFGSGTKRYYLREDLFMELKHFSDILRDTWLCSLSNFWRRIKNEDVDLGDTD